MFLNLILIVSTMIYPHPAARAVSRNSLAAGYKTEVIIYAAGLSDRRNFPLYKGLLKQGYDLCIKLQDEKYVNEFSQIADKYKAEECKECKDDYDVRILIEIYKKGKLQSEIEIMAPGATIRVKNKTYYLDKKFYDFFKDFLPKKDQNNYLPMVQARQPG